MIVRQGLCVSEYIIRYDGNPVYVVAIVEFAGTKVVRETHYFADPFPPTRVAGALGRANGNRLRRSKETGL